MENKLIRKLSNGDTIAFTSVFKEMYPKLCFFADKILGSKEDAEDIVATVFARLYHSNEKFRHAQKLEAFLYTSMRNACINHIKKLQRQENNARGYSQLQQLDDPDTIETLIIRSELFNEMLKEIKKLPDIYREVLEMSVFHGMKNDEIADRLKISLSNVTSRKSRAIGMLRLRLSEEGLLALYILVLRSFH